MQDDELHLVSPVLASTLVPDLSSAISRLSLRAVESLLKQGVPAHPAVLGLPRSADCYGYFMNDGPLYSFGKYLTEPVLDLLIEYGWTSRHIDEVLGKLRKTEAEALACAPLVQASAKCGCAATAALMRASASPCWLGPEWWHRSRKHSGRLRSLC